MGSPWLWRGVAALGLVAALAGAAFWLDHRGYRRGEAAAEARWAARAEEARDRYEAEIARSQAILDATDGLLRELEGRGREVRWRVKEVYRESPEARAWADTAIPDDLRRVFPGRADPAVPTDPR